MLNQALRMAAAIALSGAFFSAAAAPSQAQDLAGDFRLAETGTPAQAERAANDKIAFEATSPPLPNSKSGHVPPVPETGTLAMLIAGLGMIVIAQRRRPSTA